MATKYCKQLEDIRSELTEISEREAMKLWRLARNMEKRGCDAKTINEIRDEAHRLHMNNHPGWLLDPFYGYDRFKYAFKF